MIPFLGGRTVVRHCVLGVSFVMVFFALPITVQADITTGLVGYWNLDQGSGTVAADASGNNHHGTLTNGPTWVPGKIDNSALQFNSDANDVLVVGNPSLLNDISPLSISLWVKPTELATEEYLVSKLNTTSLGWRFSVSTGNNDNFTFTSDFDGATDLNVRSAVGSAQYGSWQHVVMTWDGSTSASNVHIYVNGVETSYHVRTNGAGNRVSDATRILKIGNNGGSRPFVGSLDDIRIYQRVLTPTDVADLYAFTGAGIIPDTTAPEVSSVNSSVTRTGAVVTWITDEPATTQINYGLTSTYTASSTLDTIASTTHSVLLSDLTPNTTYHFRVRSTDISGNAVVSGDYSFTTLSTAGGPTICGTVCTTLEDGMKWVFFGDSITDAHGYTDYFESYFHLRYPELALHFRTEGRGGASIDMSDDRYGALVYSWSPDFVSPMFGHNGGDSVDLHESFLNILIDDYIIGTTDATPVLFSAHPQNSSDGKPILGQYADRMIGVGQTRGLPYADIWHYLQPIFAANLASTTPVSLQGVDITHPGPSGHLAIAYALLRKLQVDGEVSSAVINGVTGEVISESYADISNASTTDIGIDFTRLDERLPMAFDDNAREIFKLMPQVLDMNKYMLTITDLVPGTYQVYVDGIFSATTTSEALASGWNMTTMTQGPIHDQLVEVLGRIRDKEGINRIPVAGGGNLIVKADVSPRQGVAKYKSSAGSSYSTGLRGEDLKASVANEIAETNNFDALIQAAIQPVARNFSIRKVEVIVPPDTTAPVVSVTAPTASSTLVGSLIAVSANATDNESVVGVQFKLDGITDMALEDTSSPYSIVWDSMTASEGLHSISAVARDPSGNIATSSEIMVNVSRGGIVGHWNFDEGTSTTASDVINANNGTLLSGPTWVTGHQGGGIQFDGVDDRVRVGDPAILRNMSPMSISLWVKPTELTTEEYLVSKLNTTSLGWRFTIGTGNNDNFQFTSDHDGSADLSVRSAVGSVQYGAWQHVVMTWDGSTNASNVRMYVNGTETSYHIRTNGVGNRISDTARNLVIGANSVGGRPFSGVIDEVKIYNKVLTPQEVTDIYSGN